MPNTILYNDSGLSKKDIQRIKNKSTKKSIHIKTDELKKIEYKNIYNHKKQDKIILNNEYNTKNKNTYTLYNGLIKTNYIKTNNKTNNTNISVNKLIKDFDIKLKSTTEIVTIKDTKGCDLNFIYNIEGGPRGKDGKDGPPGPSSGTGVTYFLGQDVGTTSDVEFNSVSVTDSYTLGNTTVTSTQWNYLSTMDQDVNTTSDVTFNSVTATTSYTLGNTTVTATEWNYLATMDQDVNTTSDVTFNSVTATTSYTLGNTTIDATQWNYLATMDQDVNTTSDVTFNSVTATTSYTLGNTTVTETQWNYLATMDQDVNTTSDVKFDRINLPTDPNNLNASNKGLYFGSNETVGIFGLGGVWLGFKMNSTVQYYMGPQFRPTSTNSRDLGFPIFRWKNLYCYNGDFTTSVIIGTNTINTTIASHLVSINQDLKTTDDVTFNRIVCSSGTGLNIATSFTPSSTTGTEGVTGDIAWDDDYIYVKTNVGWKRAGLTSF